MSKTLLIKTSWNEVTLSEYMKVSELEYDEKLKKFNLTRSIKMIAALSNKSEKELLTYDNKMFGTLFEKIGFIFNEDIKDLSKKPFDVNGKKYMFVENFNNLTTGEMISVEQLLLDAGDSGESFLPDLLAILIRPAIEYKTESGKKAFKAEDFDTKKLKDRRALFLSKLFVPYFVNRITAFTFGTGTQGDNLNPSSVRINQLRKKLLQSLNL